MTIWRRLYLSASFIYPRMNHIMAVTQKDPKIITIQLCWLSGCCHRCRSVMADVLLRCCLHPGCPATTTGTYCRQHERPKRRVTPTPAKYRSQHAAFYSSTTWRRFRLMILHDRPICESCGRAPANEVHHLTPVGADWSRRLEKDNVLALCKSCHSRHTAAETAAKRRAARRDATATRS